MNNWRFRTKISWILFGLVGLSVAAAGIIIAERAEERHMDLLRESMLRQIGIILETVPWMEGSDPAARIMYFTDQAVRLKEATGSRVTFIDRDGTVLGDSDEAPETMENHLDRPEVAEAGRTRGPGFGVRHSETVDSDMMYAAHPVEQNGEIAGYVRIAASLEAVSAQVSGIWQFMAAVVVLVFAVCGLIGYRLALGVTRPLEMITQAARNIAQLDYSVRVSIRSRDEFGQLGEAINKMAAGLQEQLGRIRENEKRLVNVLNRLTIGVILIGRDERIVLANPASGQLLGFAPDELPGKSLSEAGLHAELTGLIRDGLLGSKRLREEMVLYYPQETILETNIVPFHPDEDDRTGALVILYDITGLRRLERMRSEFVANVSHELKTPIAAVKGFTETLLGGAMDDRETAISFLRIIQEESDRLDRLIADILELSKIESRTVPLQFSPVHLEPFVGQTVSMVRTEADKKRIRLALEVPGDIWLEADEDRLRQILLNLLTNGIQYTPAGGTVTVRAEIVADERVRIAVEDTGIGIPKKDLPRIFERFYRVDKARSRSSGGTGLGLSIVKHLVELHHGTIRADSRSGVGSVFTIELPLIQP